jgi:DNA-binding NtrC family response regulator
MLESYHWRGNIRQLKNVAEQISAIEQRRDITSDILRRYLPEEGYAVNHINGGSQAQYNDLSERELLYKILFDMRNDINDLKRMMTEALGRNNERHDHANIHGEVLGLLPEPGHSLPQHYEHSEVVEIVEEPTRELTKDDVQREQILHALRNNGFRRKDAARELFISERTLYRRMKALGIDENIK